MIYLLTRWKGGIHVEAKALAIAAPLVMLLALRPARSRTPHGTARYAVPALAAAFVLELAPRHSSRCASRPSAPPTASPTCARLGEVVGRPRPLPGAGPLRARALEGSRVGSGGLRAEPGHPARRAKRWDQGLPLDFDTVPDARMDKFRFAITTSARYMSLEQHNWQPTHVTPSYTLWRRFSPRRRMGSSTTTRRSGGRLDCSDPAQKRLSQSRAPRR